MDYLDKILSSIDKKDSSVLPIPEEKIPKMEEVKKLEQETQENESEIVLEETADYKIIKPVDEPLPIYISKILQTYLENKKEIDELIDLYYSNIVNNKIENFSVQQIAKWIKENIQPGKHINENFLITAAKIIKYRTDGYFLIQPFVEDDDLEEIMVNGLSVPVFVFHRKFKMCKTNLKFKDEKDITVIIEKIARETGRHIDTQNPLLDAHLANGSRVNATLPPISPDGPTITIRKFKKDPLTVIDLIRFGSISVDVAAFLWLAVDGLGAKPANILVAGGTGSGKTTLLNTLSLFIPPDQRVITIEDTLELQLTVDHWVRLQTRPPNIEGKGEVSMDALLVNTLRMRPDRIIVGEVRGPEARTLFTAMNTGHDGCMGTIHANTARETITRITTPPMSVPHVMVSALDLIIVSRRFNLAGKGIVRRVVEIAEVTGREGDAVTMGTLFKYDASLDKLVPTEVASRYLNTLSQYTGKSIRDLMKDKEERALILEYLVAKNIRDIKSVGEYIKRFYINREQLLQEIISEVETWEE